MRIQFNKNKLHTVFCFILIIMLAGCLTACSLITDNPTKSKEFQASFCTKHAVEWCHNRCNYKVSESTLVNVVECFKCVDCEYENCMRVGSEEYYKSNMTVIDRGNERIRKIKENQ